MDLIKLSFVNVKHFMEFEAKIDYEVVGTCPPKTHKCYDSGFLIIYAYDNLLL